MFRNAVHIDVFQIVESIHAMHAAFSLFADNYQLFL